ncbi:hypothetical protein, partial [Paraburkholderia sp.]|uniref:hypothetical protein n=1 Tax=Paraburkholderia sp. TaxID=1926495 RepID=UPI002D78E387
LSIIATGILSGRCRMQLVLSVNLLSRFSKLSKLSKPGAFNIPRSFNTPSTPNVRRAARARPCTSRMARAGSR